MERHNLFFIRFILGTGFMSGTSMKYDTMLKHHPLGIQLTRYPTKIALLFGEPNVKGGASPSHHADAPRPDDPTP